MPLHFDTANINPIPLLLDYHGWGWTSDSHENDGHDFFKVADEDTEGGFLIATGAGMPDHGEWGSWNCSSTVGPLGEVCVLPRGDFGDTHCYDSCGACDPQNSCDWTSCYDDILYTEAVIDKVMPFQVHSTLYQVSNLFCVDLDSVHQSGFSNGAMFSYFLASR